MSFPPLAARAGLIEFFEQIAEGGEPAKMEFSPIAARKMAEILRAVVDPVDTLLGLGAPDALETAIVNEAKSGRDTTFYSNDVIDLALRLEKLRGQLVQARAKERLVSAQLGPYFHRAITEMDGIWDSVDFFIDDVDPDGWDELVARARHYLGLPNVDEDEIEAQTGAGEVEAERLTWDAAAGHFVPTGQDPRKQDPRKGWRSGSDSADGDSEIVTGKLVTEAGVTREQAQQRIADILGIDPSQVTVYEGGVDLSSLDQLARLLGAPAGRPAADESKSGF